MPTPLEEIAGQDLAQVRQKKFAAMLEAMATGMVAPQQPVEAKSDSASESCTQESTTQIVHSETTIKAMTVERSSPGIAPVAASPPRGRIRRRFSRSRSPPSSRGPSPPPVPVYVQRKPIHDTWTEGDTIFLGMRVYSDKSAPAVVDGQLMSEPMPMSMPFRGPQPAVPSTS
jgi:hypothetical protein